MITNRKEDIMNAYYNESNVRRATLEDKTTSLICALISFITNKTFVTVVKLAVIAIAFFGFVATLGRIDSGSVGFFGGVIMCAVFSLLEIIVIGSMVGQKK